MIEDGYSHRHIKDVHGISLSTISRWRNESDDENRVLVIGDVHEPVSRKGYLEFCKSIHDRYKCNQVVFIGDIVDWTGISFHAAHPDCPGPSDEYELAYSKIQEWYKVFPKATVTVGNHDSRVIRLAESVNIPSKFIRNYTDIWGTPKWEWVDHTIIDDVFYSHGTGYGGLHPAYNASRHLGMSCVLGHVHSVAGVKWNVSPTKRWFGLDSGCGIDQKAYAFAYGKSMKRRPVISCGVVLGGDDAHVHLMPLEKYKS